HAVIRWMEGGYDAERRRAGGAVESAMRVNVSNRSGLTSAAAWTVAVVVVFLASIGAGASPAHAQNAAQPQTRLANAITGEPRAYGAPPQTAVPNERGAKPPARRSKAPVASDRAKPIRHYFIEFRARLAESYGHAYLAYGRVDEKGTVIQSTVAGLHPYG